MSLLFGGRDALSWRTAGGGGDGAGHEACSPPPAAAVQLCSRRMLMVGPLSARRGRLVHGERQKFTALQGTQLKPAATSRPAHLSSPLHGQAGDDAYC